VELHRDPFGREVLDDALEILEIPGKPVHAVDMEGIAGSEVIQAFFQFGSSGTTAGYLFFKPVVQVDTIQLPVGVLVNGTHSDVADVWSHSCVSFLIGVSVTKPIDHMRNNVKK
jgi:hypothetical protein